MFVLLATSTSRLRCCCEGLLFKLARVVLALVRFLSAAITVAPSFASNSQVARPMPEPAPENVGVFREKCGYLG